MNKIQQHLLFTTLFAFLGLTLCLQAEDDCSFVLNFPLSGNPVTPGWLGRPEITNSSLGTLNLPLTPPNPNDALIVTVIFQEKEGGFLRVNWLGPQTATALSNNLYEDINMPNQRSLLLDASTLQGGGILNFQASGAELGIERIKFEWVKPQTALVTPTIQDTLVTTENQKTQKADDLSGQPPLSEPFTWLHQVVSTLITDAPQRVEQGVEYSLQLDQLPQTARISLKENGLPFGQKLVVWVNQQRAATVTPSVPDLNDPGYIDPNCFIGWREVSVLLPAHFLKEGINCVQFSTEDDLANPEETQTNTVPLALRDVTLQTAYPPQIPPPIVQPVVPPENSVNSHPAQL